MSDGGALTVPVAGWYPDRNESNTVRWWDGQQWTDHTQSTAPAAAAFAEPVSVAAFGFVAPESNPIAQAHQTPPGWYPDNANPSIQRWWDGRDWTAHTTPTVVAPQPTPGYVGATKNTFATLALLLSIVSFAGLIFAPLLLVAVGGIVMSIVALRRARRFQPGAGRRGQAIAGIVVGAVSAVMTIVLTVAALSVYQQLHSSLGPQNAGGQSETQSGAAPGSSDIVFPSTVAELKQSIATSVARQDSVTVTTVTCDAAASMVSGSMFQCGVLVADGRWGSIQVQIGRPAASGMSYGLGFGPLMASGSTPPPANYTVDSIKQELSVNLQQAWDSPVTNITCADSASAAVGSQFPCDVALADGRAGLLVITMVDPGGYDVSVVRPPAASGDSTDSGSSDPDLSDS